MNLSSFLKNQVFKFVPDKKVIYYNLSNNFVNTPVENVNYLDIIKSKETFFFIDGGVSTLFESNSCYVFKIKIACVKFEGNNLIGREEHNFHLVSYIKREDKLRIKNKVFTSDQTKKLFDIDLEQFSNQDQFDKEYYDLSDFSNLPNSGPMVMKILEWTYIRNLSKQNAIIVKDGAFEIKHKIELDIVKEFNTKSSICGISKNSNFIDQNGFSLSTRLLKMELIESELREDQLKANQNKIILSDCFGYQDILSDNFDSIKIHLVKLNKNSPAYFRLDLLAKKNQNNNTKNFEFIQKLAFNSHDNAIIGYPYGLVLVDQLARVSNKDAEYERIKLLYSDKELKDLLEGLSYNNNFHSILDNLQF